MTLLLAVGCSNDTAPSSAPDPPPTQTQPSDAVADSTPGDPPAETQPAVTAESSEPPAQADATQPAPPPAEESTKPRVVLSTSKGDIVLELDAEKAPISVKNFLEYVDAGFYNGTIFHRVIPTFMVQGGQFLPGMEKRTEGIRPEIQNEWQNGLSNVRGSVAMARLGRQPNSATAQFFINVKDNLILDQPRDGAGYAVFGKVVSGMDVVEAIRVVPTTTKTVTVIVERDGASREMQVPHGDVPTEDVILKTARKLP